MLPENRPYTIVNVAMTVDGKMNTVERRGAPISPAADRQRADSQGSILLHYTVKIAP